MRNVDTVLTIILVTREPRDTETVMRGSEGGRWKRPAISRTSLAAYPTRKRGSAGGPREKARATGTSPAAYPTRGGAVGKVLVQASNSLAAYSAFSRPGGG